MTDGHHGVLHLEAPDLAVGRQQHFGVREGAQGFRATLRHDDARAHVAVELEADPVARDRGGRQQEQGGSGHHGFFSPAGLPGRGEEPQRIVPVNLVDDRSRQCEPTKRRVEFGRAQFVAAAQELPVREPGRVYFRREFGIGHVRAAARVRAVQDAVLELDEEATHLRADPHSPAVADAGGAPRGRRSHSGSGAGTRQCGRRPTPAKRGEHRRSAVPDAGRGRGRARRPAARTTAIPGAPPCGTGGARRSIRDRHGSVICSSGSQAFRGSPWCPSTGTPRFWSHSKSGSKRGSSIMTVRPSASRCCMPTSFQIFTATAPCASAASSSRSTPRASRGARCRPRRMLPRRRSDRARRAQRDRIGKLPLERREIRVVDVDRQHAEPVGARSRDELRQLAGEMHVQVDLVDTGKIRLGVQAGPSSATAVSRQQRGDRQAQRICASS